MPPGLVFDLACLFPTKQAPPLEYALQYRHLLLNMHKKHYLWHVDERRIYQIPKWAIKAHTSVHSELLKDRLKHVKGMVAQDIEFFSTAMAIPLRKDCGGLYWMDWTKRFKMVYNLCVKYNWIQVLQTQHMWSGPAGDKHLGILQKLHTHGFLTDKVSPRKKPLRAKRAKTAKRRKTSHVYQKVNAKNATHVASVVRTVAPSPVKKHVHEHEERRSAKKKRLRREKAAAKSAKKAEKEAKLSNKRKSKHLAPRTVQTAYSTGGIPPPRTDANSVHQHAASAAGSDHAFAQAEKVGVSTASVICM